MQLNAIEKKEISAYVFTLGRYKETYHEVYDHVLNALAEMPGTFDLNLVQKIIEVDFGGVNAIRKQENIYQKQIKRRYLKLMGWEMLYSFRPKQILPNLILLLLCVVLYTNHLYLASLFKTIYLSILVLIVMAGIFWIIYRYIIHRKTKKDSIKHELVFGLLFLPIAFINIFLNPLLGKEVNVTSSSQQLILLSIFFCVSVYLRAFIKLYSERIKILAV